MITQHYPFHGYFEKAHNFDVKKNMSKLTVFMPDFLQCSHLGRTGER